jgi:hypothetical protein
VCTTLLIPCWSWSDRFLQHTTTARRVRRAPPSTSAPTAACHPGGCAVVSGTPRNHNHVSAIVLAIRTRVRHPTCRPTQWRATLLVLAYSVHCTGTGDFINVQTVRDHASV